jgi:hypothetical protein
MTTIRFVRDFQKAPIMVVDWPTVPRVGEFLLIDGSTLRVKQTGWSVEGIATVVLGD